MVARFVFLLFIFQYVLNAKAVSLAFAQDTILQGADIVVSWDLDGADIQRFTLELRSPFSDTLLDSQSVNTNGTYYDQVEFDSKKLKTGHCYARAVAPNSTVLGATKDPALTILDPSVTSTSSSSSSSSSSTNTTILETSSTPSTTITNSTTATASNTTASPTLKGPIEEGSTGNTKQTGPTTTSSPILPSPAGFTYTSSEPQTRPTSNDSAPATSTNPKHSSLAVILGAVLGSVVGLGLLICVALIFLKRRRKAIRESTPSFFPARMIASVQNPHEEEILRRMSQFKYGPDEEDETTRRLEDWKYGGAGRAEEDELYHFPVYLSATSRPVWREEAGLQ